jgi:hypothetical protein
MTASGSGGPPLPSISVAPTNAMPSAGAGRQDASDAIASSNDAIADGRVRRMRSEEEIQEGERVAKPMQDPLRAALYLGR